MSELNFLLKHFYYFTKGLKISLNKKKEIPKRMTRSDGNSDRKATFQGKPSVWFA